MFQEIWDSWRFHFELSLICLVVGMIVTLPLLLSKTFRKRFERSNYDLEAMGAIALFVAIVVTGLYNYFAVRGGAR